MQIYSVISPSPDFGTWIIYCQTISSISLILLTYILDDVICEARLVVYATVIQPLPWDQHIFFCFRRFGSYR